MPLDLIIVLVKVYAVPPYIYAPRVPTNNSGVFTQWDGPSGARAGFLDTAHTVSGRHCCLYHVSSFDAAIGLDDGCYGPVLQSTNGYLRAYDFVLLLFVVADTKFKQSLKKECQEYSTWLIRYVMHAAYTWLA